MFLVSLQKSCMKNRNPVPHVVGGSVLLQSERRPSEKKFVNPPESSALTASDDARLLIHKVRSSCTVADLVL